MRHNSKRAAFTLIEIIMVIVILGIVAMIGTDIIAKMYQGYMRSKIISELQQKTELSLDQIAKRLQYRIKATVVTKDASNPATIKSLSSDANGTYNMLEWIGYDNEGFLGEYNGSVFTPGWSGFIDLDDRANTDENQTSTKGSTLSSAKRTIMALSYGAIDLNSTTVGVDYPAMIFKKHFFGATPRTFGFDPTHIADHNDTYPVRMISDNVLEFVENIPDKSISEQYYLAWTAYALVPVGISNRDFNLTLHYNYQPWQGEKFNDAATQKMVIAEHVSTFRFTQTGTTIRIKLCIQDDNKTGTPIGFCKEKAVF
jgi:prepilin-type N-terminal cleavage/methylation domain-containing protein